MTLPARLVSRDGTGRGRRSRHLYDEEEGKRSEVTPHPSPPQGRPSFDIKGVEGTQSRNDKTPLKLCPSPWTRSVVGDRDDRRLRSQTTHSGDRVKVVAGGGGTVGANEKTHVYSYGVMGDGGSRVTTNWNPLSEDQERQDSREENLP